MGAAYSAFVRVKFWGLSDDNLGKIFFPIRIMNELGLRSENEEVFQIRFGNLSFPAKVVATNQRKAVAYICFPKNVPFLRLPKQLRAKIQRKSDEIDLGAVLGIMVAPHQLNKVLGEEGAGWRKLFACAKKHNVLAYLFLGEGLEEGSVTGYSICGDKWEKGQFPLPTVVYDQALDSFDCRENSKINSIRQKLKEEFSIPFVNYTGKIDKWEVYQLLKNNNLQSYLPETAICENIEIILKFVDSYGIAYLKPKVFNLQSGVMKLCRQEDGSVACKYWKNKHKESMVFYTKKDLQAFYDKTIAPVGYLVQQPVHLLHYKGAKTDFRVFVQKNGNGRWNDAAVFVRTGFKHGSTWMPQILQDFPCLLEPQLVKEMKESAQKIAEVLESFFSQAGEYSLDFGVEAEGRLWFLDAGFRLFNIPLWEFDKPYLKEISENLIVYSLNLHEYKKRNYKDA